MAVHSAVTASMEYTCIANMRNYRKKGKGSCLHCLTHHASMHCLVVHGLWIFTARTCWAYNIPQQHASTTNLMDMHPTMSYGVAADSRMHVLSCWGGWPKFMAGSIDNMCFYLLGLKTACLSPHASLIRHTLTLCIVRICAGSPHR